MTQLIAQTYTITHGYRAYITYALIGMTMLLVSAYAANIYRVVSTTVAIREAAAAAASLSSEVQKLDVSYLELASRITPEMVRQHGMVEGEVSAYITRGAALGRVALSSHGL